MDRELLNVSGCLDPTPYEALKNINKKRYFPLVYICSPYSGDVNLNTENARKYSRYALDKGNIPIAPHLLFPQFMSEDNERELAMHFNYVLLGVCKEFWVFGEKITDGMNKEIEVARKRKMRIRYIRGTI